MAKKAMIRPAAISIDSTELVIDMSTAPRPGSVTAGRSTTLWISNWCIGSAMPSRVPLLFVRVVEGQVLGRPPLLRRLGGHPLGRANGHPNRNTEAQQDPGDHPPWRRLEDDVEARPEADPHEHAAQQHAHQAIAVAGRLRAVVARRMRGARVE